ncbi:lysosome-associated membrane glycoprotein 3 [Calypte anna]|nr:lysosome-associated membrane glycoprotein 3 [Calypte anna]
MARSTEQLILLTFACAFSPCFSKVALGDELSPETISSHHAAAFAQPLSLYQSSPHQVTKTHFNSTGSLKTTAISHETAVQTTGLSQTTTAPAHHMTAQAGAGTTQVTNEESPTVAPTTSGDDATESHQASTQALETATAAVKKTTTQLMSSAKQSGAHVSTAMTVAAPNTAPNTRMTEAAITTVAITILTVKPTTGNQTTAPKSPTATAMINTTIDPGVQTSTPPTTMTLRPTLAPQPPPIPPGTYTISSGNRTCIKAVMGLQLMAQNTQKKQMEYMSVNPNTTQTSGSCGKVQAELNLTFCGGFINFTFVKQEPVYYVSEIETSLQLSSDGMLYFAAINEKLFTTKLGNSFKCAKKQTFVLEENFQLLFVNMQLQAFDIIGNQFGKEEECFLDRNSRAAPIAVGLSILGLFVVVFATFLISRRKPHRGYERI